MGFPGSTQQWINCLLVALLASVVSTSTYADDIDVYKSRISQQQKPNILFVLDYSGSMGWGIGVGLSSNQGPSRISVLKDAMNQILDSNEDNINAGLGSLFSNTTTGIRWPISDLRADASTIDPDIPANEISVKELIKKRINEKGAGGATATVDALVEAAQYFRGDPVTHNDAPLTPSGRHRPQTWNRTEGAFTDGDDLASIAVSYSPSNAWTDDTSQDFYCNDYSESGGPNFCAQKISSNCVKRTSSETATTGYELKNNLWGDYTQCEYTRTARWETPRYNSPITDSCTGQANAIILITDGEPTAINRGNSLRSIVGNNLDACIDLENTIFATSTQTTNQGNCAIEVASRLATNTVNPYVPESRVKTYTVGFNINGPGQDFLRELATAGEGEFYYAQSPEQLNTALTLAVEDIKSGSESFSELSVDVDKTSFSHGDRVYYNLFTPSAKRAWDGNLKGFFLGTNGLLDINGNAATEDNEFKDTSQSFWSAQADGNKVKAGGASEQLLTGTRKIYTHLGDAIPPTGVSLATNNDRWLRKNNTEITNAMLGLGDDADSTRRRDAALDWIQNAPMGDPLHTKSVSVNYENDVKIVYTMTNQGLLHAIDASKPVSTSPVDNTGGEEVFAFMPKRLLKNLPDLQVNTAGEGHIYGLDGPMTRWHDDVNNDGIVNSNETVMLYFGMRRGGTAYYAMDVSTHDSPVLKWVIDENTTGFERLAQSWSRMSIIKVKNGENTERVLVFGGGYDAEAQDDVNAAVESTGNAIYMINEDGTLVKSISTENHADMKYSIASDLTVIDSDGDQHADRLYVGDLGGQLWRVDFANIAQNAVVTRLADLSDNYHQPFFYPPSVAINGPRGNRYLSVTIGSGNRTSPLLTNVQNNFYMIRDTDVDIGAPSDEFSTVTVTDLYDATNNDIQSTDTQTADSAKNALKEARGWRVKLEMDEKSLSGVLTYEGKVMATTFKAASQTDDDNDECTFQTTGGFYIMDVDDAGIQNTSLDDSLGDGDVNDTGNPRPRGGRSKALNTQGIPSGPIPILAKGTNTLQIIVGKETVQQFDRTLSRVYWIAR
ncbi:MAG: PilC/PilY family type IV pilus protein [Granulosicoccus sp.]